MKRIDDVLRGSGLPLPPDGAQGEPAPPVHDEACPRCSGAGYLRRAVPLGHPEFGKPVPCDCVLDEAEDERARRLERYSNLGPLSERRFETLDETGRTPDPAAQRHFKGVLEEARRYAADPQGWFVLTGPAGSGKTHLAAAIANAVIAQGKPALFVFVPDLLDHLRAAYRPDSELSYDRLFEQVRNAPLLIMDDVDAYSPTPWATEKLFQLVNHRYAARLPTVFTLKTDLNDLDDRLKARLSDGALSQVHEVGAASADLYQQVGGMTREQLVRYTFASFDQRRPEVTPEQRTTLRQAFTAATAFAEHPDGWLVFLGETGCGKTHLAAAVANAVLERGIPVFFAVVPDLLDHLRATFGPESGLSYDRVFDRIRTAPLLVLDDLGAHSSRPWAEEKLYQIVNYRYLERLPTVVTGNFHPTDLDARVASRITDSRLSNTIAIDAPDYRAGGAARPQPERRYRR